MRASALSFNSQYPLISSRSSSSCLRLLPGPPLLSIFPSITCFRRQFLRKMWPIQLAFLLFIVCRIFLSSWLCVTLFHFPHEWSIWSSPSFSTTKSQKFLGTSGLFLVWYWYIGPEKIPHSNEIWLCYHHLQCICVYYYMHNYIIDSVIVAATQRHRVRSWTRPYNYYNSFILWSLIGHTRPCSPDETWCAVQEEQHSLENWDLAFEHHLRELLLSTNNVWWNQIFNNS